jgi:hypothetical protein
MPSRWTARGLGWTVPKRQRCLNRQTQASTAAKSCCQLAPPTRMSWLGQAGFADVPRMICRPLRNHSAKAPWRASAPSARAGSRAEVRGRCKVDG